MSDLKIIGAEAGSNNDGREPNRVFYRCELPSKPVFALADGNLITTGLTLVPHYVEAFDFVDNDISEIGIEASIVIPDGLAAGEIYEATVTNIGRDWESGWIDSYDIEFVHVSDAEELARIARLRVLHNQAEEES